MNVEMSKGNGLSEKTWPSSHPLISIDHMFISGDLAVEKVQVPTDGVVRTASDHLPFFVQLGLPDIAVSDNLTLTVPEVGLSIHDEG